MKKTKKKGFTLVELIVVIAIIAILAAVAVPLTMDYLNKAEKTATADEIKLIKDNLAVVSTDINGSDKGTVDHAGVVTFVKNHISLPEHIDNLTLNIDKDGNVTVKKFTGKKFYNLDTFDAEKNADYDAAKKDGHLAVVNSGTTSETPGNVRPAETYTVGKVSPAVFVDNFINGAGKTSVDIVIIKTTNGKTEWGTGAGADVVPQPEE